MSDLTHHRNLASHVDSVADADVITNLKLTDSYLGVISEFHTSRTNERTFISGGGGLDPIRCAIDSKKISLSQILNSFSLSSSPSFSKKN